MTDAIPPVPVLSIAGAETVSGLHAGYGGKPVLQGIDHGHPCAKARSSQ